MTERVGAVILALRQYPQGGAPPIPLSLDGRGIKGEGENDASSRHCGLGPQSRGEGRGTRHSMRPSPSFPRRRESIKRCSSIVPILKILILTNHHAPAPCGYCLEASMTVRRVPPPRHSRVGGNPHGAGVWSEFLDSSLCSE